MNHPTDEVDELYELAQEALACEDYPQAIIFLKRGLEIAPLRKDLRRALADALARDTAAGTLSTSNSTVADPRTVKSTAATAAGPPQASGSTWMRPSRAKSTTAISTPRIAPTPRTHGSLSLALDEEDFDLAEAAEVETPEPETRFPDRTDRVEEPSTKTPATRRRSRRTREFEDVLADLLENLGTLFTPHNRVRMAHGTAYAAVALFIGVACYNSQIKFGPQLERYASTQAKPPVASVPTPEPRLLMGSVASPELAPVIEDTTVLNDAQQQFNGGNFDEAIGLLTPVVQTGARTPYRDSAKQLLAKAYDAKATRKLKDGAVSTAVEAYREAVKLAPADSGFRLHLANALYYAGADSGGTAKPLVNEALQIALDIVKSDPKNVNAYQVQGRCYSALGQGGSARKAWQAVVTHSPTKSRAAEEAKKEIAALRSS